MPFDIKNVNRDYAQEITLERNAEGRIVDIKADVKKPQTPDLDYEPFGMLREAAVDGRKVNLPLWEAALTKPDAANILRQDIRFMAFSAFGAQPPSFEAFTWMQGSNYEQETYLRDATFGVIPKAPSGTPAPEIKFDFEGGVTIKNYLHRAIASVPMDLVKFDQIGKIKQIAFGLGRGAWATREDEVYKFLTTTSNYGRNSTTNDNNFGANQQTLTWNADSLRTALAIIATSKDRKSGQPLGYAADTVICGPLMQVPVLQLLTSADLQRATDAAATEYIGTGTRNPMYGLISKIIVNPWFGASYGWALCDSRANGFTVQTVEPFNVYQETQNITSESWLVLDSIRYLVRGMFGVGFVDDRAWFYSDSSTDATVS